MKKHILWRSTPILKNKYSEDDIIKMLEFLVDNIFVVFAWKVFQQTVGIPMGTNCAPLLADIFLYSYEADFIQSLLSTGKKHLASRFNLTLQVHRWCIVHKQPRNSKNIWARCIPAELEIKDTTESTTSASYLDLLLSIGGGMVNFTLRSTTNEMISISTSQTFRSWVVIFHLRQPMEFLSLNFIRYSRACSLVWMFLYWGPGDFPVSYSNRDTLRNAWNRHSGSFMVDMGILFSNMKYPSHEC